MKIRLIETIVVFEWLQIKMIQSQQVLINRNNSCIWITNDFTDLIGIPLLINRNNSCIWMEDKILYCHLYRLIETIVVFELVIRLYVFQRQWINRNNSCIWIPVTTNGLDKFRRINRNNSCIWIQNKLLDCLAWNWLIETIVVFEFPVLVFSPIWKHWLIETIVVFE